MTDPKNTDDIIFTTDPEGRTRIEDRPSQDAPGPHVIQDMSFSTHILSLNAMALMHLGEVDGVPEIDRDLSAAEHLIDTLKMLTQKTTGNLTPQEKQLLDTLMYDLQVKFLKAQT